MTDFSQAVLASGLCFVSNTVIIQIQLVAAVTAWVDTECDGVHLAVSVKLTDVLLQLTLGYNGAFPDVNGTVVSIGVVPRSIKVELYPSLDRILKRAFVICETVPLASRREVYGTLCLSWYTKITRVSFVAFM